MSPRENQAGNITRSKNDKIEAFLLWTHHEKAGLFGKDNNTRKVEGSRKRERPSRRQLTP